jgi:hypothetical protein
MKAQEFPCGHLRFLPTRYRGGPICQASKVAAKLKRQRDFHNKVAGIAEGIKGNTDVGHMDVHMENWKGGPA